LKFKQPAHVGKFKYSPSGFDVPNLKAVLIHKPGGNSTIHVTALDSVPNGISDGNVTDCFPILRFEDFDGIFGCHIQPGAV